MTSPTINVPTSRAVLTGASLVEGSGTGPILKLTAPLSLWNGIDTTTGTIIEPGHPEVGADITDKILVLTGVKGATASIGLTESLRTGHGPAGLVLAQRDVTIVTASVVAGLLYDKEIPVLLLSAADLATFTTDASATLTGDTLTLDGSARVSHD